MFSSAIICFGASLTNVLQISSSRSTSRSARSRMWRISRSAAVCTFRFASAFAPAASSSARSASSFSERSWSSESRSASTSFFSSSISASRVDWSLCRPSSSTDVMMFAAK